MLKRREGSRAGFKEVSLFLSRMGATSYVNHIIILGFHAWGGRSGGGGPIGVPGKEKRRTRKPNRFIVSGNALSNGHSIRKKGPRSRRDAK